ncbi:MAG: hypothetical protein ABJM06_08390 [Gilvibacter sp.]
MKKIVFLLLCAISFTSCDDGDIIVTTFDFDAILLENCGEVGDYVFYKINNENLEAISLSLGTTDEIYLTTADRTYTLDGTSNVANYRTFTAEVDDAYFCSNVPPSEPQLVSDFIGSSGDALLQVTAVLDDNDGLIEDIDDEIDTDGDGLPDYIDFDDDGDNVPTSQELDTENADGDDDPLTNPKDTDGDGIPNYLDPDDDGDGVLTINEDTNKDLNPANDVTEPSVGPDYLNPGITVETLINEYRSHSYTLNSSVNVTLNDVVLVSDSEEIIRETLPLGIIENAFSATATLTPEFIED